MAPWAERSNRRLALFLPNRRRPQDWVRCVARRPPHWVRIFKLADGALGRALESAAGFVLPNRRRPQDWVRCAARQTTPLGSYFQTPKPSWPWRSNWRLGLFLQPAAYPQNATGPRGVKLQETRPDFGPARLTSQANWLCCSQASFKRSDDAAPVVHDKQIGVEFGCKRDCRCFTCTEFGH